MCDADSPTRGTVRPTFRPDRAVRLVWGCAPGWTGLNLAFVLLLGLLPLATVYLTKLIVDSVTAGISGQVAYRQALTAALLFVGAAGVVESIRALLNSASSVVRSLLGELTAVRIHLLIHAKAAKVELDCYENSDFCDLLHRAQQEAGHRPVAIVDELTRSVLHAISFLAMAGLLFSLSVFLPLLVLASGIPDFFVRTRFANLLHNWHRGRTFHDRLAWIFHWIVTSRSHAKEIRSYQLGDFFSERFQELREENLDQRRRLLTRRAAGEFLCGSLGVAAFYGSFAVVVYWTLAGDITLGAMVMFHQALLTGRTSFQEFMKSLAGLHEHNLFLQSMYEFLDTKREEKTENGAVDFPHGLERGLVLENVSFRYPGSSRQVLTNVRLVAEPGLIVGLVGPNGSGKSTIAKLICRFYEPDSGALTLEGIDLRRIDRESFRRNSAAIMQDYEQYPLTVRENVHLGDIRNPPDLQRITSAATAATGHEMFRSLENGYETVLGRWIQGAAELSTGQWQRLALARLLYRDARLLVLDEPTSSMDAEAEKEFLGNLKALSDGKVVILITHRDSALQFADRIYRLEDGRLIPDRR